MKRTGTKMKRAAGIAAMLLLVGCAFAEEGATVGRPDDAGPRIERAEKDGATGERRVSEGRQKREDGKRVAESRRDGATGERRVSEGRQKREDGKRVAEGRRDGATGDRRVSEGRQKREDGKNVAEGRRDGPLVKEKAFHGKKSAPKLPGGNVGGQREKDIGRENDGVYHRQKKEGF